MKVPSTPEKMRHLSVVSPKNASAAKLTRAQVAARLSISISTVRRYEGSRLHPHVDEDDVHWFEPKEVAELAAELLNDPRAERRRNANPNTGAAEPQNSRGELAALVFERLEQRQSLAEIVIGVRIEPDLVRALFEQWCLGLIEGQLQMAREPRIPREHEITRVRPDTLASLLAKLPLGQLARISVGRFRGDFQHGDHAYAEVVELGGFLVSGPCAVAEITGRFGTGDYRVTAYGFDPAGLRWEVLVEELSHGTGQTA